jgi:hypothetical protein
MTTNENRGPAQTHHLHALVERLVREGRSEREIARAVDRAAEPSRRKAA